MFRCYSYIRSETIAHLGYEFNQKIAQVGDRPIVGQCLFGTV